jgi:outer membrane autotransporter protein
VKEVSKLCADNLLRRGSTPPQRALGAFSVVVLLAALAEAGPASAQNATWAGPGAEWTTDANWSPMTAPTGVATFTNNGAPTSVTISNSTSIGEIVFSANAPGYFLDIVANKTFLLNGVGITNNALSAPTFTNNGIFGFGNAAVAGNAGLFNGVSGTINFQNSSSADHSTIVNIGNINFLTLSSAGNATITNNGGGSILFQTGATAGSANIVNNLGGALGFLNTSTAGNATITNGSGGFEFANMSTAGNAVIIDNIGGATTFVGNATGGNARLVSNVNWFDFSATKGPNNDGKVSAGSIEGAGDFFLGANELTVGGNNLSTNVSGVISDCGGILCAGVSNVNVVPAGGSLVKVGTGTLTLSGMNLYTGATTINNGVLEVDGSIATSSLTTVNSGATLQGVGTVGNTAIASGGIFNPGNGTPNSSMTVAGNLALASGAMYLVQVSPTTASSTSVTGTAALGGATVSATYAGGSYISKQYTILSATGGVNGTFGSLTNTNLPANFTSSLTYDASHAYLNLALNFTPPLGTPTPATPVFISLNTNQQNVANTLVNYFNTTGGIPAAFGTLSSSQLSQVDGENATGAQKGAFQLMSDFLNLMLDPSGGGGGGPGNGGALGFAPVRDDAGFPSDIASAYAGVLRSPKPQDFERRWSAWGSAFGGSASFNGDPAVGSANVTASDFGFAGGMDYHVAPDTLVGFALAGGGTNWNLAQGLGSGRSDAFEGGVYARTHDGPAYLSAALAYANHWFTTDRTAAFGDQLQAKFQGQSVGGRLEAGYRFDLPSANGVAGIIDVVGFTPYAAMQAQSFHTPSYSETDLTGGGFGLTYNAQTATDTRSELGVRADDLAMLGAMPVILRGRLAWAHDWVSNPALGAVFQALPGTNFIVNGAAPPKNSALATLGAELRMTPNWSLMGKFDGQFGNGAQTYAGTGTLRYSW